MSDLYTLIAAPVEGIPGGYGFALAKMLMALIGVCLLAYFILYYLKQHLTKMQIGGKNLHIVEHCLLSSRQHLWIVEASGRFFLLGTQDGPTGAITRIAELDADRIHARSEPEPKSFSDWLKLRRKDPPQGMR